MDGNGLRERRPKEPDKEPDKDHNDDIQSHLEGRESEKTFGRTPDGTGKSIVWRFICGRVKLVSGFVTGNTSQSEG